MITPSSSKPDPDMEKVYPALIRAGERARELARITGVPLVFEKDGKVVYEPVPKDEPSAGGTLITDIE